MRLFDYEFSGNCLKARAVASILGIDLELVPTDIFAGDTLTEEYARVNPLRTTPVLEIQDGRYLRESNAICLYLADGSRLLPDGAADRAEVASWLFFERAFTPAVGGLRFVVLTGRDALLHPAVVDDMRTTGTRLLRKLDEHLTGREYVALDRLTVADVVLWSYAHVAHEVGYEPGEHVAAWIARVREEPGMVGDLEPYPENARPGNSRSIYG